MTFDDDYIGSESCFDLQTENNVVDDSHIDDMNSEMKTSCSVMEKIRGKERVFPPPMPLLARTQNLASHMPWVMKRYTTTEGRLIIKEEKVKHHEFFRAHRSNGRLTLELVPLDDSDDEEEDQESMSPTTSPNDDNNIRDHQSVGINNDVNRFEDEENEEEEEEEKNENENEKIVGGGGGDNGRKCMNYNAFGVPLPLPLQPIRTVRG